MSKHTMANHTIAEMSVQELRAKVEKARALLSQVAALLPGLVTLSVDERKHSNGKLHADEVIAMKMLLVAAGKHPQTFAALADKDGGADKKVFEVEPAIDDLDRVAALGDLVADAESLAQTLSDTLLTFGSAARAVGVPVHAIINANKTVDPRLASDVAEGLEFYASRGRSAARSRAKSKAAAGGTSVK